MMRSLVVLIVVLFSSVACGQNNTSIGISQHNIPEIHISEPLQLRLHPPAMVRPLHLQSYPRTFDALWKSVDMATHYELELYEFIDSITTKLLLKSDRLADTFYHFENLAVGQYFLVVKSEDSLGHIKGGQTRLEFIVDQSLRISASPSASAVQVYPNPVVGNRISIGGLHTNFPLQVHVIDIVGRIILTGYIQATQPGIDISSLKPGSYNIVCSNGEHRIPFVKQ